MDRRAKIYVAGHRGLAGSAILRRLEAEGFASILVRTRAELDLTRIEPVEDFFRRERPEYVFLAAGRTGGIQINLETPADLLLENLLIQGSVLRAARLTGVRRLIFFAASCLYPRDCPQPMKEERILTGPMEPSSEAYATAKLAGLALCEAFNRQHKTEFITVIPATLYGPNDDFNPDTSHVLSALLRRFHEARGRDRVTVWGTGAPVREFLHADDLADACLFLMRRGGPPPPSPINIGTGRGIRIRELAGEIARVTGFSGRIEFDATKPDGAPEKVLDTSRLGKLGWTAATDLREGLRRTYEWYLTQS